MFWKKGIVCVKKGLSKKVCQKDFLYLFARQKLWAHVQWRTNFGERLQRLLWQKSTEAQIADLEEV